MDRGSLIGVMEQALYAYEDRDRAGALKLEDEATGLQCTVRRREGVLIIAFRGSDSLRDWRANLAFFQRPLPCAGSAPGGRVHGGFGGAYCRSAIPQRLMELAASGPGRVLVCGHSLGAAMAVLCAAQLTERFPGLPVEVGLFGCPRVGNRAFCREYDRRVPRTLRVENGSDIVTRLPPAILGFRHVGVLLAIGPSRYRLIPSLAQHRPEAYLRALEAWRTKRPAGANPADHERNIEG